MTFVSPSSSPHVSIPYLCPVFPPVCSRQWSIGASQLCFQPRYNIGGLPAVVAEATREDELWAAARLRIRSFHNFPPSSYGIEEHRKYLAEREFEAMKQRIAGTITAFRRVSCINATVPLSQLLKFCYGNEELLLECKYTEDDDERVVVGTLDINQCLRLPDEITGKRPEGIGSDFARAYLSNVCVAKELHRNGIGRDLIAKAKLVAQDWGISDLYVHVAIDNDPARKLYDKCGFVYENDEPLWQARHLNRPRRILLWMGLSGSSNL